MTPKQEHTLLKNIYQESNSYSEFMIKVNLNTLNKALAHKFIQNIFYIESRSIKTKAAKFIKEAVDLKEMSIKFVWKTIGAI